MLSEVAVTVFDEMARYEYGELHIGRNEATGLKALIAIHDTRLGGSLGGCRFVHYGTEEAAILDALRLAQGMSYKAAIAGLPHGGGKAVILRPEGEFDREALFESFGDFIEGLGGRYTTAEDSGTTRADMAAIRRRTRHVTGLEEGSGDPSPYTALGVRRGIEAMVHHALGRTSLQGLRVAVQGVGAVGYYLCRELDDLGASLVVTDVDPGRVERVEREFGAESVGVDEIFGVECDVLAPCALGGAIDDQTLPRLRCAIVAGGANNQLREPRHGDALLAQGIAYAPDYVINAGGLIAVADELNGFDEARVRAQVEAIHDIVLQIAERATKEALAPHRVAERMARERLARVKA